MKYLKRFKIEIGITLLFFALIRLILPSGAVYGSTVDWLSQHVALAETIRDACVEQKTLLPAFLPLGGGSNGFQFAYYGYLRPDILLGCLFPQIPMEHLLITYMLGGYLISVLLFYRLLKEELSSTFYAFLGSMLFLFAACFFHTHRQVMFINYMPFLIGAFYAVKKKRTVLATLLMLLVYLNSFYYAIAALAALGWYWYRLEGKSFFKSYVKMGCFSVGMAALLLLPTFCSILENHRATTSPSSIPLVLPKMQFLLYGHYGMGLTAVCLYCLLCGLSFRKFRMDSIFYLLLSGCGIFAWILNGTLYTRGKILIPFVPLIVLFSMKVLMYLQEQKRWQLWPFLPLLGCLFLWRKSDSFSLMCVELILLLFCAIRVKYGRKWLTSSCLLLLLVPFVSFLQENKTETFVTKDMLEEAKSASFSVNCEADYRTDSLVDALWTSNQNSGGAKSSMYSSVTNPDYSHFYYDILQTPVQINNRIAVLPEENPFLLHVMGIRYLTTTKDKIPDGYSVIAKRGDTVLVENQNVRPMFATVAEKDVVSEKTFDGMSEMEQLETLVKYAVVEDDTITDSSSKDGSKNKENSQIQPASLEELFSMEDCQSKNAAITTCEQGYRIKAEKNVVLEIPLKNALCDKILLLQFAVENQTPDAVVIDVNGIRNKLSGEYAAYPNQNSTFHYQLTGNNGEPLSTLKIKLSKGEYFLNDFSCFLCDKTIFAGDTFSGVSMDDAERGECYHCHVNLDENGYLITSIPRQRGLNIKIDGNETKLLTVSTAFAGAKLSKGKHEIIITFSPPGLKAGYFISAVCLLLFGTDCYLTIFSQTRKKEDTYEEESEYCGTVL